MTEQEVYLKIKPLLEGLTEGIYWDFKKTLNDVADIIKDVLAFSNSDYMGDSYIIVGVSETNSNDEMTRISLTSEDRKRLSTDANFIYLPAKWNIHGLSAKDLEKMKQFSASFSEKLAENMLISQPKCEFIPIQINRTRWLYVIVVKKVPGVFICKKDIAHSYDESKIAVKQGVLYVRLADTTIGAKTVVASAAEHVRVWKRYIDWLGMQRNICDNGSIEKIEEIKNNAEIKAALEAIGFINGDEQNE